MDNIDIDLLWKMSWIGDYWLNCLTPEFSVMIKLGVSFYVENKWL